MSERRGRSNTRKATGNFHNWQKKIKLQIKEALQRQEEDIKGPLHLLTSLKKQTNRKLKTSNKQKV